MVSYDSAEVEFLSPMGLVTMTKFILLSRDDTRSVSHEMKVMEQTRSLVGTPYP